MILMIIDALDRELIERFNVNLKLDYWGEFKTPINPKTPFAVASMITGLPYKDMGKHEQYLKNGFKKIYGNVKTIFDYTDSIAIDIPSYNSPGTEGLIELVVKGKLREASERAWILFERRVNKFLKNIDKANLVAVWFGILDRITHIWFTRPAIELKELEKGYRRMEQIVKKIKDRRLLIVSDHGRNHRPVAYYTSNFPCKITKYEDVFKNLRDEIT